jgi:DNA-binding NtrC family response regulator
MVLVVQADETAAGVSSRALRRAGYAPRVTGSAGEAAELLVRKSFAAVVLADSLADGSPWTVLAAAQAAPVPAPVVVITDTGAEGIAAEAQRRGAAAILPRTGDYAGRLPGTIDRAVRLAEAGQVQ